MTTPREQALMLRLAAAEVAGEERSVFVLRRILRDLGWSDAALDAATARVTTAARAELRQADLFERAV